MNISSNEQALFAPSSDAAKRYKEQLEGLLKSSNPKTETIDMGNLPAVFTVLGISDQQLKTNGKAIRKALGLEGKNRHHVPIGVIENLPSLTHDPEAVFKSLSRSDNPSAYVAVLNAKAENQEQIIAILSPSKDGKGFTFIPSVYEKHNFQQFIGKSLEEGKVLYIKNESSEIWGQLQSLPRHNPEPSIKSILTKSDVVKVFSSLETAKTIGYIQGVCECVAAVGDEYSLGKKLLLEMKVTKEMAQQYARPETYKTLEQGIFAQKQEHKLQQAQRNRR